MNRNSEMSENIIFKEVVTDENGEPVENEDGTMILCETIFEGERTNMFLEKNELSNSGILHINTGNNEESCENQWSSNMTKLLLDKYEEYIPNVGPMKRFRLKKNLWEQISYDLKKFLHVNRTTQQVENRFKTIMKRKKSSMDNNSRSGEVRHVVEYEEELNKIAAVDDSLQPEVLKSQENVTCNKKPKIEKEKKSNIQQVLKEMHEQRQALIEKLHTEKELQKEKRHQEKMDLLKEFISQTKKAKID